MLPRRTARWRVNCSGELRVLLMPIIEINEELTRIIRGRSIELVTQERRIGYNRL